MIIPPIVLFKICAKMAIYNCISKPNNNFAEKFKKAGSPKSEDGKKEREREMGN